MIIGSGLRAGRAGGRHAMGGHGGSDGSACRTLRNDDRRQSGLMFATRITLPHFSVSPAMNFPNAAGACRVAQLARSDMLDLGPVSCKWIFDRQLPSPGLCPGWRSNLVRCLALHLAVRKDSAPPCRRYAGLGDHDASLLLGPSRRGPRKQRAGLR
jgi:hypothetical protein